MHGYTNNSARFYRQNETTKMLLNVTSYEYQITTSSFIVCIHKTTPKITFENNTSPTEKEKKDKESRTKF